MQILSRRDFLWAAGMVGTIGVACGRRHCANSPRCLAGFAFDGQEQVRLTVPGLGETVRVLVIGDTHLGLYDERDKVYADNYHRMANKAASCELFEKKLMEFKAAKPDLLLLVGDNISFPTLANVDYLTSRLNESGLDWYYVAGNHDWHFEGLPGSDEELRAAWIEKRLKSLYRGRDPLMSSRVVKGIRFVAIDNSIYHISERQLEFFRTEVARNEPVVLFMHIPLWLPEWGLFTCGCPTWGCATDPYWQIERRERWAEKQSLATFAFREESFSAENVKAIFTGHHHRLMMAHECGKLLLSVPDNRSGASMSVTLKG